VQSQNIPEIVPQESKKNRQLRIQEHILCIIYEYIEPLRELWARYTDHPSISFGRTRSLNVLERSTHAIMITVEDLLGAPSAPISSAFRSVMHSLLCSHECVVTQSKMVCEYVESALQSEADVVFLHELSRHDLLELQARSVELELSVCATEPFEGDKHRITAAVYKPDVSAEVVHLCDDRNKSYQCVICTFSDGTKIAGIHFPCGHGDKVREVGAKLEVAAGRLRDVHGVTVLMGDFNTRDAIPGWQDVSVEKSSDSHPKHAGFDRAVVCFQHAHAAIVVNGSVAVDM
jgi:endonuclease/exonuclease/phosphatase family metal-dependent hydrolase